MTMMLITDNWNYPNNDNHDTETMIMYNDDADYTDNWNDPNNDDHDTETMIMYNDDDNDYSRLEERNRNVAKNQ